MKKLSLILTIMLFSVAFGCSGNRDNNSERQQVKDTVVKTSANEESGLDTIKEVTFTAEQLKGYYASYKNPFAQHLRKVLSDYLKGKKDEIDSEVVSGRKEGNATYGLSSFDNEYYKSKFAILWLTDALMGGKEIVIVFQDKPDKIFHAWVYKLDGGSFELREFWEDSESTKELPGIIKAYGKYLFDKEHSL